MPNSANADEGNHRRSIPLLSGSRIVRPLRFDLGTSPDRRCGGGNSQSAATRINRLWRVLPTFHWREILSQESYVTAIVRGEGEETARRLMRALEFRHPLGEVAGIAYRERGRPCATRAAPVIRDLDAYRIGWELIDHARYSYWGGLRAVVVQFSRGCPHLCNYCGQRGFWTRWRHRDPVRFV